MPPKAEAKTGKKPTSASGKGKGKKAKKGEGKGKKNTEQTPEQLMAAQIRVQLADLTLKCEQEKREINEFQQQKAKIAQFWQLEKLTRDDFKEKLVRKLKEKTDLEEKQLYELKIYKEKVKHLLYEQQSETADTRIDGESHLKTQQDAQRGVEHDLVQNVRQAKTRRKELAVSHYQLVSNIKQDQEKKLMALRQEYERCADELQQMHRKKQKAVRREFQEQRKADIKKIEMKKDGHILKLMQKHQQAFDEIKTYYRDITHNNLDLIKSLKDEVGEMKRKDQADEKNAHDIHTLNAKLSQPLQRNLALVEELKRDLRTYEHDKQTLESTKESIQVLEGQIYNLSWEHEILQQKFTQLQEERDELKEKLQSTVCNVHQKTGFQGLLLEKRLAAMAEDLEKTEVALAEILISAGGGGGAAGSQAALGVKADSNDASPPRTLQELMFTKNQSINVLQQQIFAYKMQYNDMLVAFEDTLLKNEIPPENIGFVAKPMML